MANPLEVQYGEADPHIFLALMRMDLDAGQLGRFFGSKGNAPVNICGLVAVALIVPIMPLVYWPGAMPPLEYLKAVSPILTGILGFLFGSRKDG